MELVAGSIVGGRFRLERELGKGGMGAVWLAHHIGLDVPCAVKFILSQAAEAPEVRARFEREARAAAHIKSPHVVQILDYGLWEDTPYIAMEYLEGEDLGARLARRGRLDARETATIVGQVARALGKAHAMGIVHRDIKPSNIFLVRDDDREIAKVVDFGIAKSHSPSVGLGQTRTGTLLGTPRYMSPEQAQGVRAVDHRSDLWALGVVAFQCLTGRLPFESESFGDLVLKIMVEPLPVPSRFAPVPPGFDAWWARAVARDPDQRFQSAAELAEALYLALDLSTHGFEELRDSGPPSSRSIPPGAPIDSMAPSAHAGSTPPPRTPTPSGAVLSVTPAAQPGKHRLAAVAAIAGGIALAGAAVLVVLLRHPAPAADRARAPEIAAAPAPTAPPVASAAEPLGEAVPDAGEAPAPTAAASESASSRAAPPRAGARPRKLCKPAGQKCLSSDDCCDRVCRGWTCRANEALRDPYGSGEKKKK